MRYDQVIDLADEAVLSLAKAMDRKRIELSEEDYTEIRDKFIEVVDEVLGN